jgi:hypothetical protein
MTDRLLVAVRRRVMQIDAPNQLREPLTDYRVQTNSTKFFSAKFGLALLLTANSFQCDAMGIPAKTCM